MLHKWYFSRDFLIFTFLLCTCNLCIIVVNLSVLDDNIDNRYFAEDKCCLCKWEQRLGSYFRKSKQCFDVDRKNNQIQNFESGRTVVNFNKMSVIPPVIVPAVLKQTATILFLHGLGDTGHGWASELAEIKPKYAKLICPTAEEAPVTINAGSEMPSWFDIRSLNKMDGNEDEAGIKKASELITKLINDEIQAGIPASRILLGGFSQGGALSLYTGLTGPNLLGGVLVLSGYLPIRNTIDWNAIQKPPILQCHGDKDQVVLYEIGKGVSELLTKQSLPNYSFKTYKGLQHSSNEREMKNVQEFFNERLPPI